MNLLLDLKHLKLISLPTRPVICKCLLVVIGLIVLRAIVSPFLAINLSEKSFYEPPTLDLFPGVRKDKFVEVPQIIWGLNNQKIAFARACLTAKFLNRSLLMPSLSASLFYKEVDLLQPIPFDKVFDFNKFNARCHGFARLAWYSEVSNHTEPYKLQKGSGRRWTVERDLDQLQESKTGEADNYQVIHVTGKHPFLWPDHWPVKDYAKVFDCLALAPEIETEVVKVISKIKDAGEKARHEAAISHNKKRIDDGSLNLPVQYIAVHMRIEKDWMIHCKKWEKRSNLKEICSSKGEIIHKVSQITDLRRPVVVYLAVADSLLEDDSVTSGWRVGMIAYEKKKLGVTDIYKRQPYLIKSAIDFEVCARADVFVGNSFSTFSNLVVLSRTERMYKLGVESSCGEDVGLSSYAYNVIGDDGGPQRWMTDMLDTSLQRISYGTNNISCH
ncbi:O-fucosyltransferase 23 [Aegilops tauschii subsp. strangulata]|uniref:O-fucosyltransferase family protein n=2 Tax=Aegilops tauschii TaxID=37682 RepID=A0A453QN18_AEGTS|nr:O-fucosyltransferase 23 [Aegilops tauschii subsp. strangulata]XP_020180317.1 O-fucosyltransferase 23 [Aegilops tauschii subsp. strangulata]